MSAIPSFPEGSVESLAKLLGECGTGSDISRVLADRGICDGSGASTKWRRLYWIFLDIQRRDSCANRILDFIQSFLAPARFVGRNDEFEAHRSELNTVLALSGFEYRADGKFRTRPAVATLPEAERRANTIQSKFQGRRIHPEVLKYCKAELMQHNYFHAVFEASKGLAQRIRDKSGVDGDGANLVDRVFSSKPESTDGRREDSGRGVRELRARWPGLHWGRWEGGGRSSVAAQGPYGRLRGLRCAGW